MPEEPANKPVENQDKKKKDRSPAYPAIGLQKAVENAEKLWTGGVKQYSVLISVAAEAMGYLATSSVGVSAISAMKKFGLLEEEGSKDQRKVRLTDFAKSILNPNTPNKDRLLREAALKPTIHSELWKQYQGGLPPDAQIKNDLTWGRQFTEAAAVALIEEFRGTIAFAKLTPGDTVEKSVGELFEITPPTQEQLPEPLQTRQTSQPATPEVTGTQTFSRPSSAPPSSSAKLAQPALDPSIKYFTIPTDIGDAHIPMGMSEEDFTLFGDALKLFKKKIVKGSRFPIGAVWKNADHDKPVTIVGEMGIEDGVLYYMTQDATGIPENELTFAS